MTSLLKQRPKKGKPQDGKQWLHPADLLTDAAAVYPVKLLGTTEVTQAKGTEVIRDAITKVQFAKHIKQSEAGKKGSKLRKVDLKISVNSIKVDDTKTKEEIYSYPLHHISYCADDKRSRKVFAFIAKDKTCPQHTCYVFECEKQAEELTLTVGQAFDLAYRRYLENVGRQKLQAAESERDSMKQKLSELEKSQESTNSEPSTNKTTTPAPASTWPNQTPANNNQNVNLWDDATPVPNLPPPPSKQTHQDTFDPFATSVSTTNGGSSPQMPFDQQPVAPHTISSPFEDSPSPSPLDKVANPFDQMFEEQQQPPSTFSFNTFDSFDPLDSAPPPVQSNQPFGNNQASLLSVNDQATSVFSTDSSPAVDAIPNNNNIYAQPHVQRPRPTPRNNIPASLPPPPSKQSVKAAKAAAAAGKKQESPPVTVPFNQAAPSQNQPSSDFLGLDARPNSPGNPFSRPADFDPFADSFDPLDSKPPQVNNQITNLQSDFSRGMVLDSNDLLS